MSEHEQTQALLRVLARTQPNQKTILLPEPIVNEITGKEEEKSILFERIELSQVLQYIADLM